MSRGYSEGDCESNVCFLWDSIIKTAIRGPRGQRLIRETGTALDAMPVKELATDLLVEDGQVCALGAVAVARGIDVSRIDPDDAPAVARALGIPKTLAREIANENDECGRRGETPAQRWQRMRAWVNANVLPDAVEAQ